FFAEDFTLAEIKTLRARQSHPYREQAYNGLFEIPTLLEIIDLVKRVEAETHQKIGIYPETKHPTYSRQLGLPLEEPLIETLIANQFTDTDRVFIQSFEVSNLKDTLPALMAAHRIQFPLIQLYEAFHRQPYDFVVVGDPRTYGDLISAESLKQFVAPYASGIGVWKRSIVLTEAVQSPVNSSGNAGRERLTGEILPVVAHAHAAGLVVHPYTFRNEAHFLAVDYQGDAIAEYQQFYQLGVDGVFSDFPDTAVQARNREVLDRESKTIDF
ncbi:MAG TPA: glycerophosphodiester phosphodiesterase family protein, partial [Allocoleopsis sp.]